MRQLSWAACLAAVALCLSCPVAWAARCTGSSACRACKNCRYCKHCAKEGGTCSVCSPAAHRRPPLPALAARPAPRLSITERARKKPARRPAPGSR
jgi:hypothetical protein